jgi:peptidoglycan/LPS O-acetylase OafA/YrhL
LALRAHTNASIQWWYVFYLQNWIIEPLQPIRTLEHFWSLAIEEQFYLVWPMLVYLTSRRALSRICLLLPLVSLTLRIGLCYYGFTPWDVYEFTITRLDGLALGAFLAVAVRDPRAFGWVRRFSAPIAVVAAVGLAGMGIHTENLQQRVMADGSVAWIGFTVAYTVVLSAASYGLARISWWALESRFLKLKDYFAPGTRAAGPSEHCARLARTD